MSAVERLATALDKSDIPDPAWANEAAGSVNQSVNWAGWVRTLSEFDPTLLADIEDGAALRRLAAVVPDGWEAVARFGGWHKWPMVEVWDPAYPPSRDDPEQPRYISSEATIAAAADACRVALEEGR